MYVYQSKSRVVLISVNAGDGVSISGHQENGGATVGWVVHNNNMAMRGGLPVIRGSI